MICMRLSLRRAAHGGRRPQHEAGNPIGRPRLNVVGILVAVVIVVVIPVVMVAVVFVVPVTLVVSPSAIVVVVVRVAPIRALIGRPAPHSGGPDISAPVPVPISIDPGVTSTWHRSPLFVA
jgi:hypothetical protein